MRMARNEVGRCALLRRRAAGQGRDAPRRLAERSQSPIAGRQKRSRPSPNGASCQKPGERARSLYPIADLTVVYAEVHLKSHSGGLNLNFTHLVFSQLFQAFSNFTLPGGSKPSSFRRHQGPRPISGKRGSSELVRGPVAAGAYGICLISHRRAAFLFQGARPIQRSGKPSSCVGRRRVGGPRRRPHVGAQPGRIKKGQSKSSRFAPDEGRGGARCGRGHVHPLLMMSAKAFGRRETALLMRHGLLFQRAGVNS